MTEAGTIRVSAQDLASLAVQARRNGTQGAFIDMAVQWASQAAQEIDRLTALLADRDEREAALRAEVERLKAAIDMQPSPPTREDMEWAGKVFLAEAEKENDALRAEVEALKADLSTYMQAANEHLADAEALRAEVADLKRAVQHEAEYRNAVRAPKPRHKKAQVSGRSR